MSGFNFFRDGGERLLSGIGSNAFQAGIDENKARQDAEIARQQKAYEQQRQRKYHSAMAEAMSTGNVDRAAYTAYEYGDDKVGTGIGNVRKEQHARTGAANTGYANVAASLGRLPYEQRRGALAAATPRLVELGLSADEIANFDPTDANLAAIAGVDYSLKDRDANDVAVFEANTGRMDSETKREELYQPKVVGGGAALVGMDGKPLYRAPEYHEFNTDDNVVATPGIESSGSTITPVAPPGGTGVDQVFGALIMQESSGVAGRIGPPTKYGRAVGMTQVLPSTGQGVAKKLGIQWRPELMRGTSPEAAQYQMRIGRAYFDEGMQKYGGDPRKALMYYHGGPDEAQWGPKTRAYADAVLGRAQRGDVYGQTTQVQQQRQTGTNPVVIQRGVPKPPKAGGAADGGKPIPTKWAEKYDDTANIYRSYSAAIESFRPGFGGNPLGSAENLAQGMLGDRVGTPGQRDWWAQHFSADNVQRHALFGAALTGTEKSSWASTTINPTMDDDQIMRNLRRRREIVAGNVKRYRKYLHANGYSPAAIAALSEGL